MAAKKSAKTSKTKTTKEEKTNTDVFQKAVPALLVLTVILAFFVGILWQKVSYIERYGSSGSGGSPQAGTNPAAPPAARTAEDYIALASEIGADENGLKTCVDEKRYADKVENQYQTGIDVGVTGTPGSFIINNKGDVWKIPGALSFSDVSAAIDAAMGTADAAPVSIAKLAASDAAKIAEVGNDDHIVGNPDAPVTIIEFSDYECPYCKSFHPTIKQVLSEYDNEVRLVYRHFPLDMIHPNARGIAEISECVHELAGDEAFWEFTDAVFSS